MGRNGPADFQFSLNKADTLHRLKINFQIWNLIQIKFTINDVKNDIDSIIKDIQNLSERSLVVRS